MASVAAIRFCAFFLGILALLFLLIATPTHHWYHASTGGNDTSTQQEMYGGIFEDCKTHSGSHEYSCSTPKATGYLKATKAFMILAVVTYILVTVYTLIMAFTRGISCKVLSVLTILAGIFTLVGMSIYTDQHKIVDAETMTYGYSYGLGWASTVFSLVAGILIYFGDAEDYQTM